MTKQRLLVSMALFCCCGLQTLAADIDQLRVQRVEQFAFDSAPTIKYSKDRVTIRFATTAFCDVTVAVENQEGKIVRHLASGLLGKNAPPPFQRNSLSQTILWNAKDDLGEYVQDIHRHKIRVSLGLKARFERTLFWSAKKRAGDPKSISKQPSLIVAAKEGVYVYDGGGYDWVQLYDHQGNYLRTIYPFAARELSKISNLRWHDFPQDGKKMPLRWGLAQTTFLTSGSLGYGRENWPTGGSGNAASAITIYKDNLLLVNQRVNYLRIRGDAALSEGPVTGVPLRVRDAKFDTSFIRDFHVSPRNCAVSPDGRWLYLAGFNFNAYFRTHALHGVARVSLTDPNAKPELFAGKLLSGKQEGHGKDNDRFSMPSSVACDLQGRVYITDWGNNRIQVFSADRKLLKTIPATRPARIRIHPKTGELYLFSWPISYSAVPVSATSIQSKLTILGPYENPRQIAVYDLPIEKRDVNTRRAEADVDFFTEQPTIWLARNKPTSYRSWPIEKMGILLLTEQDGKLVVQRDFAAEALTETQRIRGPRHGRQRLFVNPTSGTLYIGEHHDPAPIHVKSITELIAIDPETGKIRLDPIPFDTEDIAFDRRGRAYLRTIDSIARFDPQTWREVPFDYGEEKKKHGYHPIKQSRVLSVITAVGQGNSSLQMGGMAVSPKGHVAVSFYNPSQPADLRQDKTIHTANTRQYATKMFPGKKRGYEIHVWDEHGELLYEDALPGIGSMSGLNMDKEDNLYVLSAASRIYAGNPFFNDLTCTLIKATPGKAKILSSKSVLPLAKSMKPDRPADLRKGDLGKAWVTGAQWLYGGVGMDAKMLSSASRDCHCQATSRPALDYFARSFLPEVDRCSVVCVDSNGNTILRIGQYGNVDDGRPLVSAGGPQNAHSTGGDEVAICWASHVATDTDRRLFIADIGNGRLLSVKLEYHTSKIISLEDVGRERR